MGGVPSLLGRSHPLYLIFQADGYMDPTVHAMEVAATPQIWGLGCELLSHTTKWYVFLYRF